MLLNVIVEWHSSEIKLHLVIGVSVRYSCIKVACKYEVLNESSDSGRILAIIRVTVPDHLIHLVVVVLRTYSYRGYK